MILEFFKGYREARVLAIAASVPDYFVDGEGEWFSFSRTPYGVPVLRLARTQKEAGLGATCLYKNEVPRLPTDFPPWISKSRFLKEGPFLVGHRYKQTNIIGRSQRGPAHVEKLTLRFIDSGIDQDLDGETFFNFELLEVETKIVDKNPAEQPPLRERSKGGTLRIFFGSGLLDNWVYLGPPQA